MSLASGGAPDDPVLVLAPTGRDAALTCLFLRDAGIAALECPDIAALCGGLFGSSAALISEEALSSRALEVLTRCVEAQPPWSDVPLAVFRRSVLTQEAMSPTLVTLLRRGNVTVLDRPLRRATLVSTVRAFQRARRRQYEVRELLGELEKAVEERDRFLAMLGHELRNPLGAILTTTEVMARRDPGTFRREREVISRQTRLLTRLVDDLLEVARITSGKIVLQQRPMDVSELAERVTAGFLEPAAARGVSIRFRGSPVPVPVDGDPERLEQVLGNLVTNAMKYTPAGGEVVLAVEARDGEAVLAVRDDGVGIAPDLLPRVFDLFVQAEGSLDRSQGGMGIGLTLVKGLVSLHGGRVEASSAGPGKGSEFTVTLPLCGDPAGAEKVPEAAARATPARRIVIVEDNADLREQLSELLADAGHAVLSAENGVTGVDRIVETRPELALVDIGLPGIDGFEVARRVRAAVGNGVLLVALTGYGQPEDRRRAMEAGFDLHLAKPLRISRLEEIVAELRGAPAHAG